MSNDYDNGGKRHAGQQSEQEHSDAKRHADRHSQQDKSSKGFDTKRDNEEQERAGKGKIATSAPGGSDADTE